MASSQNFQKVVLINADKTILDRQYQITDQGIFSTIQTLIQENFYEEFDS